MSEPVADAVILGGGVAGHHLARELAASAWAAGRRIVLVDAHGADLAGRRWAYWSTTAEPDAWRRWDALAVHLRGRRTVLRPTRNRYWQVRGEDLTARSRQQWAGRVEVVRARASGVQPRGATTVVRTDAGELAARWVFDGVLGASVAPALRLWFTGAEVTRDPRHHGHPDRDSGSDSDEDSDQDVVTLVDDRIPTSSAFGFGYLLPLHGSRALVEVTRFCHERPAALDDDLAAYVALRWPGGRVGSWRESGGLALVPPPRSRRRGPALMLIGTPAGAVRASTGYGFTRMRSDARAIAASLCAHGHPFAVPRLLPRRHGWADTVLLDLMAQDPSSVFEVFAALFGGVDVDTVLDFLDGTTTAAQERAIVRTLPTAALAGAVRGRLRRRLFGRAPLDPPA